MCLVHQPPGKFEGETCITKFAHWVVLNGFGDTCEQHNQDSDNCEVVEPPFSAQDVGEYNADNDGDPMCAECAMELVGRQERIHTWEDDSGFVYAT